MLNQELVAGYLFKCRICLLSLSGGRPTPNVELGTGRCAVGWPSPCCGYYIIQRVTADQHNMQVYNVWRIYAVMMLATGLDFG